MSETLTHAVSLFQEAAQLALSTLERFADREELVVHHLEPEALKQVLDLELPRQGRGLDEAMELARKTLHYSVATGHPRFLNQLFGGHDAAGLLGEWITALTNTSMYTYEAAPVGTVVELALLQKLADFVGFQDCEGVLAPGGSIANLMAALAARHQHFPHAKKEGLKADDRPVLFCSAEAHYSIKRAAMVLGIGTDGCVLVPVDEVGRMIPSELERLIVEAKAAGQTPFLVCATTGATVTGAFDPVDAIADVTERHRLWLHIDGSYGGSALLSETHKHLLEGSERADSMTWNPHKMMGIPLACAALLTKERGTLINSMAMSAEYLFHEDSEPDYDLGDRSLQCGRRVDALKLWFSWQATGDEGFEQRIDDLFEQAQTLRKLVRERSGFRLIRKQEGTNVCFRYLPRAHRNAKGDERVQHEHEATLRIRRAMAREGSFLVNYAQLDGAATFRAVASNQKTTTDDLAAMLDRIAAE